MAYRRKTWREKLADDKGLPKLAKLEGKLSQRWGTGTMVIPLPRMRCQPARTTPWK